MICFNMCIKMCHIAWKYGKIYNIVGILAIAKISLNAQLNINKPVYINPWICNVSSISVARKGKAAIFATEYVES